MARSKSLRSQLYRAARDLENVGAVENGAVSGGATNDERDELCERHHLPGGCVDNAPARLVGRRKR